MQLIWCSDIHLNFLGPVGRMDFYQQLKHSDVKNLLITGDIAESHNIEQMLREISEYAGKKTYFVAGNHDFYGSSIADVRTKLKQNTDANYLPKWFGYKLDDETWLTGVDGWGDCRNGDVENSHLTMADWEYIEELRLEYRREKDVPIKTLQKYADADAEKICKNVQKCIDKGAKRIVIASHVPPFEEACLYAGKKSTPSGLPFFSSYILGFSILPIVENNPNVDFLWLSGHTHSGCKIEKRPNLTVQVAEARYFIPQIEEVIDI